METRALIILLVVIAPISQSLANTPKSSNANLKGPYQGNPSANPAKSPVPQLSGSNQGKQLPGQEGGHNGPEETVDIVLGDCDQCSCKLILREETERDDDKCEKIMDIRCTCNGNHCTSKEISNCLADMADTSQ
uniref:Uncharacterized protein n=1 Tax=Rhipicephalus zambeziensis TaxID=60191 RepID=A0A224Y9I7_9ACAR